jgi:hypothetical protein
MSRFNKKAYVMVRMTTEQKQRLAKGARKVTNDRSENVEASTLARELIMQGLDRLLGSEAPAESPVAESAA